MIVLNNSAFKIFFLIVFFDIVLHIILDRSVTNSVTERKEKKVLYLIKKKKEKNCSLLMPLEKIYCY